MCFFSIRVVRQLISHYLSCAARPKVDQRAGQLSQDVLETIYLIFRNRLSKTVEHKFGEKETCGGCTDGTVFAGSRASLENPRQSRASRMSASRGKSVDLASSFIKSAQSLRQNISIG